MSEAAIRVDRLSKRYRLGEATAGRRGLKETLAARVGRLWRREAGADVDFWALRDVSFEAPRGAVTSIIGRNGAGKSTLLRILSRITEPTSGRAEIYGRLATVLDVGTGFQPDLTGRENVYLNGAILGMRKVDIDRRFDEIVAFAEVGGFIDTPVKRYSTGMWVRLAFAVAAHLEPEILFVDEVLAVGDAAFQKKCLGRMEDAAAEGRTVIFVSHDTRAVMTLAEYAVFLEGGRLRQVGRVSEVLPAYLESMDVRVPRGERTIVAEPDLPLAVTGVRTVDHGAVSGVVARSRPLAVVLEGEVHEVRASEEYFVAVDVTRIDGTLLFRTHNVEERGVAAIPRRRGRFTVQFLVPAGLLPAGTYRIGVTAGICGKLELQSVAAALEVDVVEDGHGDNGRLGTPGLVAPRCAWRLPTAA
jgi:lipopolysaccharide transport system ATP-binding protein